MRTTRQRHHLPTADELGEVLIMTLLVIIVISVTCAALLSLQWTGSKAQTTTVAVRTDSIAVDTALDEVIGVIRKDPSYGIAITPAADHTGKSCYDAQYAQTLYHDSDVEVNCTPQPSGAVAPNHRAVTLEAYAYSGGTQGALLARTTIDVADADLSGAPAPGFSVSVRSWIKEPGQ